MEFDFNLALARDIVAALAGQGLEGRLINADGLIPSLSARARAAQGAQLFIAVHHDSVQPQFLSTWIHEGAEEHYAEGFQGYSLFVSRKAHVLRPALACASALGARLRGEGFSPSLYHAAHIPGEWKPFADKANGVHYYDNLVVLKEARVPALLLEAGVIVDRDEELRLADAERRGAMARAVAQGVRDCLGGRSS
jgi:N-acetylmuramoyl-L-alanine amidase